MVATFEQMPAVLTTLLDTHAMVPALAVLLGGAVAWLVLRGTVALAARREARRLGEVLKVVARG